MSDLKTLVMMVVTFGALAAMWWFGWFAGVTHQFMQIKQYTTHY